MNNVQQLRVQLEKMYGCMGGEQLEPQTQQILKDLQSKLNKVLEKLAAEFAASLESNIQESMHKVGALLAKVKGVGQVQKQQVVGEADMILEPIMDLLDHSLTQYAQQCEKTVLKKLLKVRQDAHPLGTNYVIFRMLSRSYGASQWASWRKWSFYHHSPTRT